MKHILIIFVLVLLQSCSWNNPTTATIYAKGHAKENYSSREMTLRTDSTFHLIMRDFFDQEHINGRWRITGDSMLLYTFDKNKELLHSLWRKNESSSKYLYLSGAADSAIMRMEIILE